MKKNLCFLTVVLISIFMLIGTATAWQGRMAGMDDPYGLVQDESDMLIHPAMIMNSSGTRFYTHYRFTYTDVLDWDYDWNFDVIAGSEFDYDFKASGDEFKNEALVGSAFNFGPGRMGVFFTFENLIGDYDGKIKSSGGPSDQDFDLDSDKSDFALRFLYGFPVDCTNIGFEAGFAYHNEENKTVQETMGMKMKNNVFPSVLLPVYIWSNIYPYMIPYDSEYYDIFAKASIASELGCAADFGLTVNGSFIYSGENKLHSVGYTLFPGNIDTKLDGDVDGFSVGGDFWLRYKIDDTMSLPFLLSANYKRIVRDGQDDIVITGTSVDFYYEHTEVTWDIEAGGGLDIALDNASKIASGIYYRYLDNTNGFIVNAVTPTQSINTDMDEIPDYSEHRITLKVAYETEISPTVGFRAGFDSFYGWADWDYKNKFFTGTLGEKEGVNMDGGIWGIGITLGGTIKMDPLTLEPFIGAAYQQTDLDGDGKSSGTGGPPSANTDADSDKDQWMLTTGLSILF